ncbi:MAG: hypothetical protein IAF58_00300 [Leptolyngbya sp.]|nr:hypothetical protein [Candidatus Melainabacteria bacterium]
MSLTSRKLILLLALAVFTGGPVLAETSPANSSAFNLSDLEKAEMRLFSRPYKNDPPEKRIERLELLVFGATQGGSMDERWQSMAKSLKERQKDDSANATGAGSLQTGEKKANGSVSTKPPLKGNYPAVDSIEWRVLKKTYKGDPINDRVDRLETKLLGQANPGMALFDRVERLKKIAGATANSGQSSASLPPTVLGPMPRAMPRSQMPFSFGDSLMPMPFTAEQPFSNSEDFSSMNKLMTEMFGRMSRQMRDLQNVPPGVYDFKMDPSGPNSAVPNYTPFKSSPFKQGAPNFVPPVFKRVVPPELPPYADPNAL